jgi:hypothetical protein
MRVIRKSLRVGIIKNKKFMILKKHNLWLLIAILAISFISCSKDDEQTPEKSGNDEGNDIENSISPLDKPTDLLATDITLNSVSLSWSNIDSAKFYTVEYSVSDDFIEVVSTQADANKVVLNNLLSLTTYYVRVQAGNSDTLSLKSEIQNFTTLEDPNKPIVFANSKLEEIIREKISKPEGDIIKSELLAIDSLINTIGLESLVEVDLLENLKYLFIFENGYILEDAVEEFKTKLPNCTVINSKYIEQNGIYFELDTLFVESLYLESGSIYQHEVIMKGPNNAYVELDLFSDYATLTETLENVSMFANSTSMSNGTFHDKFSAFSIEGIECPDNMKDYILNLSLSNSTVGSTPVSYLSVTVMSELQSPRIGYMTSRSFE